MNWQARGPGRASPAGANDMHAPLQAFRICWHSLDDLCNGSVSPVRRGARTFRDRESSSADGFRCELDALRTVVPRAYMVMILSSNPVKRRRSCSGMSSGSNVASRSRGTSMRSGPS